ncbi:AAA family ATPase [Marine Group I thaumarchaeote]|jgi:adenylate kinase|uniref:AAA family ATPase n=1 Tax=Marine Group I thaumarchaeote TaxID=2511932 RepID=A0A7K4NJU2_9ARCH|nr:MAG: shikimate kinase [Nitrosopumilus sp. YT1]NMI82255.1 shikimate kinase [Candidatus Nitrosopumilus sp. MTA1]NWJ20478.1 AAA family ATPase [Marine Group I thaumarchaeote]NWJ28342.1 AAA family ATPase [Marine Group I thaumarchaeote]NWJ29471.1 AAA family ATPase [Marine Group I thaumarchaeote]
MSIVITGNPGVGKHTITEEIAEKLELSILDINSIAKDAGLFEKNKDTYNVDTSKLEKILEQKISEKKIIVGHLAPYVLGKNKVKIVIVLRRDPYDLISVYKERRYTDEKSKENLGSEVLGIIAHDTISKFQEKAFQINTSGKSIREVVEKVMTLISSNEGNEEVDWLDLITKKNDLKKFFND